MIFVTVTATAPGLITKKTPSTIPIIDDIAELKRNFLIVSLIAHLYSLNAGKG